MPYTVAPGDLYHPDHHFRDIAVSQLERESRARPNELEPFREGIKSLLDPDEEWPIRLQAVRLVGRLDWSSDDYSRIVAYLFEQVEGNNKFVAAWAIDTLSIFAVSDDSIHHRVMDLIHAAFESRSAAVRVRARHGLERMRRMVEV